jgi:YegS/Rv2252/BmrU family lipid kinase
MRKPRVALIENPASGSAGGDVDPVSLLADAVDVTVYRTSGVRGPAECARLALEDGAAIVVAAGGDGTVSGVGSVLAGTRVPLGVLPSGTSNSFAAALDIPSDTAAACRIILEGPRRVVDTLRCGDDVVILHAMIGLHAEVVSATTTEAKRRWGALAYMIEGLRQLQTLAPFEVRLRDGDRRYQGEAVALAIANLAPAKTAFAQGPSEVVGDDGLLDVTIVAAQTPGEVIAAGFELVRSAMAGEEAQDERIVTLRSRSVRVECHPPQTIVVDGEEGGPTPQTFLAVPRDLVVLAP